MKHETASLIIELWDIVRENIPNAKRGEVAYGIVRAFEEFGYEGKDISDICDEDKHLAQAYIDIYDIDDDFFEDDE